MGLEKRDFSFSDRAESYDEGFEGRFSKRFYRLLQAEVKLSSGMRLLDVGCGMGALLRLLCLDVDVEAHGIDTDANMITVAKRQNPSIAFQQSPCEKIPFPDSYFDVLTACMAYHHFSDKPGFAREASRVLKVGGVLYIADPRFPFVIRKCMNGALSLFRIVGEFCSVKELANRFVDYGFILTGETTDRYAQVAALTKSPGLLV
jgi:ubiquinone/menaquinone biosynthesis C-methylase UbiE